MAGIAGIIVKERKFEADFYEKAILSMLKSLSKNDEQPNKCYVDSEIACGISIPAKQKINNNYISIKSPPILCVVEGQMFIEDDKRNLVVNEYRLTSGLTDNQLLPYLYHFFGVDLVKFTSGDFNIFVYNKTDKEAVLFNSKLGTLPLYLYESNSELVFASKIESILASGLMSQVKFDAITIAEHLIFNYAISENTYIQEIETLKNATLLLYRNQSLTRKKYWEIEQLFGVKAVGAEESLFLIQNSLRNALEKITSRHNNFSLSLTGGWDSRLILSFLINDFKDKLQLYSFGARDSSDITIPQLISEKEGLRYISHILDEEYLKGTFIQKAKETILLSNGTRNYKRAHYLHSIEKIAGNSDVLISGIFGDEVFKVNKPSGGAVLAKNTVKLIENNFDPKDIILQFLQSSTSKYLNADKHWVEDGLNFRLEKIREEMKNFDTSGQKYFSFRFEKNLRKYFGAEMNSYNDYTTSYSPFIDDDFLLSFSRTKYFGARYPFDVNNIHLKRQSSMLYYKVTNGNYPALTSYPSSRGFSMKDVSTISGNLLIILQKYLRKKNDVDGFNTRSTDQLFFDSIAREPQIQSTLQIANPSEIKAQDINSLAFWMNSIVQNYPSD